MAQRDPRFPVPNRSDHDPQQDASREFFPELDIAASVLVLADGRPARIEDWFDSDMRLHCRTAFYSTIDTEQWSEDQHFRYMQDNNLLVRKTYPGNGVGLTRLTDASGNDVWSATVVISREED